MKRRTAPIGWPHRDPRHYRFAVPNLVWEYKLKPIEFMIFSYLCYHRTPGVFTPEMIAATIHMTAGTAGKYLDGLSAKKLVGEDGTPILKCRGKKFFTLPNEVFLLRLPPSAFLVYAYLLLIEESRTYTCHPSYNTIAAATQRSGCGGGRRSGEMSELCRLRRSEGYEARDDEEQDKGRGSLWRPPTAHTAPQSGSGRQETRVLEQASYDFKNFVPSVNGSILRGLAPNLAP